MSLALTPQEIRNGVDAMADPSPKATPSSSDIPSKETLKKAASLPVLSADNSSHTFASLYTTTSQSTLIVFIRHFFCGQCQDFVRALVATVPEKELELASARIVIVGCGKPGLIRHYAKETNCPFPIFADPTKRLYNTFGMVRSLDLGEKPEYETHSTLSGILSSVGQMIKNVSVNGGDYTQNGGELVFRGGECVWAHLMKTTRDHTDPKALKQVLGL